MTVREIYKKQKGKSATIPVFSSASGTTVRDIYEKRKREGLAQKVNTLLDDYQSFSKRSADWFSGADISVYRDTSENLQEMQNLVNDYSGRAAALRRDLAAYGSSYGKDWVDSVYKALSEYDTYQNDVISALMQENDYYSQFSSPEEYREHYAYTKEQDALKGFDLKKGAAELEELEKQYKNAESILMQYENWSSSRLSGSAKFSDEEVASLKAEMEKWGGYKGYKEYLGTLSEDLANKKVYYSRAERAQRASGMEKIYADFGNKESLDAWKAAFDDAQALQKVIDDARDSAATDGGTAFAADDPWQEARQTLSEKYGFYNEKLAYAMPYMDDAEFGTYMHYYEKGGSESALYYLDSIEERINAKAARGYIQDIGDNFASKLALAASAGLEQFSSGMNALFNPDESYYVPSATQMAGAEVRQNMSTAGGVMYDLVSTTANMTPSILVGMIPYVGQVAGAVTLGASASGNAYKEMVNLGYGKDQAASYAALVGGSEAGLSYLLGGIGKLGGKAVSKFVTKIDDVLGRVAVNAPGLVQSALKTTAKVGAKMGAEGFEEGLQSVLEPWFKSMATNTNFDGVDWGEVGYSALLGALSAGILEGGPTVVADGINYKDTREAGKNVLKKEGGLERLKALGSEMPMDSVAYKLAGRVNEKTGAYTLGRLFHEVGASMSEQNRADIVKSLERKGVATSDAETIAAWLGKAVEGEYFTDEQIEAIDGNELIAQTLVDVVINPNSTISQRLANLAETTASSDDAWLSKTIARMKATPETVQTVKEVFRPSEDIPAQVYFTEIPLAYKYGEIDYEQGLAELTIPDEVKRIVYNRGRIDAIAASDTTAENSVETSTPVAKSDRGSEGDSVVTQLADGTEVAVGKIVSVEGGEAIVELSDGGTIRSAALDFGSDVLNDLYYRIPQIEGVAPASADALIRAYSEMSGISVGDYARAVESGYLHGSAGIRMDQIPQTSEFWDLSEDQRKLAYELGATVRAEKDTAREAEIEKQKAENYRSAGENENVLSMIEKVNSGQAKGNDKVYLGIISASAAAEIQSITGINVDGFKVAIEARQIEHILKRHGEKGTSDKSMADPTDIAKIEYTLDNYDDIRPAGQTRAYKHFVNGKTEWTDTVLYEKEIGEKSYYVVQAVPDSKAKTLYIVTAFIGKQGYMKEVSQFIDAQSPDATPKSEIASTSTHSIPDSNVNVNSSSENNSILKPNSKTETVARKEGTVTVKADESTLSERQKVSVECLRSLAKAIGINFVVEKLSTRTAAGRVGENGRFDHKTNTVYLDLNAGNDGEGVILFTASHELTHFIAKWSPKKYKILRETLFDFYGKTNKDVLAMAHAQMEAAKAAGHPITFDAAIEEVVADAMERMLTDGNAQTFFETLEKKDKSLVEKIKDYFKDLLAKIRKAYEGAAFQSDEAQFLHESTEAVERIQALFFDALNDAGETYREIGDTAVLEEARESYSFRNSKNGMANDKLAPYSDELRSIIESRGDYIVDSYEKLRTVVDLAFDEPTRKATAYFGTINQATLEKIKNSIPNLPQDKQGTLFKEGREYSIAATLDSIRHIVDDKKLTRADVLDYMDRLADTVVDFDSVTFDVYIDAFKQKNSGLLFKKEFPDGTLISFNLVSHKKRSVSLHTLYLNRADYQKKRSAKTLLMQTASARTPEVRAGQTSNSSTNQLLNIDSNESPQPTPEASFDGSATTNSIPENTQNVNSDLKNNSDAGYSLRKPERAQSADHVTVSRGSLQKQKANYRSDRVYSKKDVVSTLNGIEGFRNMPADIRVGYIDEIWRGLNAQADAAHRETFIEAVSKRFTRDLEVEALGEDGGRIFDDLDQNEIDQLKDEATLSLQSLLDLGKPSIRAKLQEEFDASDSGRYKRMADETNERAKLLGHISTLAQKMKDLKLHTYKNASDHHPETFRGSIEEISKITWKGIFNVTRASRCFRGLAAWYTKDNPLFEYSSEEKPGYYNEEISGMLKALSGIDGAFSVEDLRMVCDVLAYFVHFDETYNKAFKDGRWVDIKEEAERYIAPMKRRIQHAGTLSKLFEKFFTASADPLSVARFVDGYEERGFYTETIEALRQGAVEAEIAEMKILADYYRFLKDNKKYIADARKETVRYRGADVPRVTLCELYMLYQREHAQAGLVINGFKFRNREEKKIRVRGLHPEYKQSQEANLPDLIRLAARDELQRIEELLTKEDKAYIKILEKVYNKDARELKRKRDYERLGYSNVYDGYYHPIRRSEIETVFDSTEIFREMDRVSNSSFNKNTVEGARGALFVGDADTVFLRHVSAVCRYATLSPAIDFVNRVYNKNIGDDPNDPVTIRGEAENVWSEGAGYIDDLIQDVQGIPADKSWMARTMSRITSWFRGQFAKFQLGLNLKTMASQGSSLFAASAILDLSSVAKAPLASAKEVYEYCPLAELRSLDSSAVKSMGLLESVGRFSNKLMAHIGWADGKIVRHLFRACQVQVERDGGAKIGTKENKKAAGELLTRVILETQQNTFATEKSAMMRSGSEVLRTFTMFSADAMKVTGRVIDGFGELIATKEQLKETGLSGEERTRLEDRLKSAKKKAARASFAAVLSAVYQVAVAEIFKLLYDKEDEEDENKVLALLGDFSENLIGGLPFVRDVVSVFINGYDIDDPSYSAVNDLIGSVKRIWSIATDIFDKDGEVESDRVASAIKQLLYAVGQVFGIPFRNVYNTVYGLIKRFLPPEVVYRIDRIFDHSNDSDELYDAILSGDTSYVELLKSGYEDESAIGEAIRKELRENDKRIGEATAAMLDGDLDSYERIVNEIAGEGYFELSDIARAINSERNAKAKEQDPEAKSRSLASVEIGEGDDAVTVYSIYSTFDINTLLRSGNVERANEIISKIVAFKVENGKTEKEARASVRSSVTSYWKEIYREVWTSKDLEEVKRIRTLLYKTELYGRLSELDDTLMSWRKEP